MKQKEIILSYLKDLNDWTEEYKIRSLHTPFGFIGARGDRNVRELIAENKVDHAMSGKYRIVKHKEVVSEKPIVKRPQIIVRGEERVAIL
jgi:hypothetical protein